MKRWMQAMNKHMPIIALYICMVLLAVVVNDLSRHHFLDQPSALIGGDNG